MKKYKVLLALACAALLVVASVAPAVAGKGPVAKATGGVTLELETNHDGSFIHASFNAHETGPDGAGKGQFNWKRVRPTGVMNRLHVDVDRVTITGNKAEFSGLVISASPNLAAYVGERLYVRCWDDPAGDVLDASWDEVNWQEHKAVGGNLVVH